MEEIIREIRSIRSGKKDLRKFGNTMGVVLALFGVLVLLKRGELSEALFFLSGFLFLCGLAAPVLLLPVQKIWMTFAVLIGWFMSRVILTVLFYLILTPVGLIARVTGRDPLNRNFDRDPEASYWIKRKPFHADQTRYEKQF